MVVCVLLLGVVVQVGLRKEGGEGERGEPDFQGLFGRPGMMNRIGFGNLIPSRDLLKSHGEVTEEKIKNQRRKRKEKTNWKIYF